MNISTYLLKTSCKKDCQESMARIIPSNSSKQSSIDNRSKWPSNSLRKQTEEEQRKNFMNSFKRVNFTTNIFKNMKILTKLSNPRYDFSRNAGSLLF